MSILLGCNQRVADIASVLEQACSFRNLDNNLYIVNVAGACHVCSPVKLDDGIHRFAALESDFREPETVVVVRSRTARLSEFPIISLRIDHFRARIQILISPGQKLIKKQGKGCV